MGPRQFEGARLDLSALDGLGAMRSLSIQGGYGAGQQVVSLEPLRGLPIEELTLMAVDGAGLDLTPLTRLPRLRALTLTGVKLDPGGTAAVAAAHPWFDPEG